MCNQTVCGLTFVRRGVKVKVQEGSLELRLGNHPLLIVCAGYGGIG